MDQHKKLSLIRKIRKVEDSNPKGKEILISVDDYFDGNDENCCNILANTCNLVSAKEFESFLNNLKKKNNVYDIFIRFYDYEDAIDFDDSWVNSDTIFVVTSAKENDVKEWFEYYSPSEVRKQTELGEFANLPSVPIGYDLISVWWD